MSAVANHVAPHRTGYVVPEQPDPLAGRVAVCPSCKTEHPSSTDLAFFEYRGPGSRYATSICMNDGFTRGAHERKVERNEPHLRNLCDRFEANPNGRDTDTYYCGCRGWD